MIRSIFALGLSAIIVSVGLSVAISSSTPAQADTAAIGAGSCDGSSNAPSGHCNTWPNTSIVDNCRCSGHTKASCGPKGSYYCENSLGVKVKASSGTACEDHCYWTPGAVSAESESIARDPVITVE